MPNSIIQSTLQNPGLFQAGAWINGRWVAGDLRFAVDNPASGEVIAQVSNLGATEAEAAIAAAEAALPAWRSKTAKERSGILRRWFDLIVANSDDLARILTLEQGKPLAEAKGEVAYGSSFLEWFAEEAKRVAGSIPASTWSDKRMLVLKQPIGGRGRVCALGLQCPQAMVFEFG